jgi:hypothetical protein
MPLARYFLFVGGVLIALLLLVAGPDRPNPPVAEQANTESPAIRIQIHSDRKWPERVVYDTSRPAIVPPPAARSAPEAATPSNDGSANTREAFASTQPSPASKPVSASLEQRESKQHQRQHKHAKRRTPPPTLFAARQPQFGWFGPGFW